MENVFIIEAMVCGYHEYTYIWDAPVGEILPCQRDVGNIYDTFDVAVVKEGTIVGHCLQPHASFLSGAVAASLVR